MSSGNCGGCKTTFKKYTGRKKTISTPQEVAAFSIALGKGLLLGTVLCDKCRRKLSQNKPGQETSGNERASSQSTTVGQPASPEPIAVPPMPAPQLNTPPSNPVPVIPPDSSSPILGEASTSARIRLARRARERKCDGCQKNVRIVTGPTKTVATQEEADIYTENCKTNIQIGSVLCHVCRVKFYKKDGSAGPTEVQTAHADSQSSPETFSSPASQTAGASSSKDPSFSSAAKTGPDTDKPTSCIEMPFARPVSTHKYCFVCGGEKDLASVPFEARQQAFSRRRLFIPKDNRCCRNHLIKKKLYEEDLQSLRPYSNTSLIEATDLQKFLEYFAVRTDSTMSDKIGEFALQENDLKVLTGLNWANIFELGDMLKAMRNTEVRNKNQAVVTLLVKLRTGNSNAVIASILGLQREQQVSEFVDAVINSFKKDVLPESFGIEAVTREEILKNQSDIAKKLLNLTDDQIVLIFDGSYVHHQKSSNNEYQRRSYSVQKKKPLCKPFTVCTTNGFVVDTLGPFAANMNDAQIIIEVLKDENGLKKLLKPGDYVVVDRGFRDAVETLKEAGLNVLMPALKGHRKQLTTKEANESRQVTKIRWPVEAVHGIIGQKYKLLHHQVDNKLLPKLQSLIRIVCFLHNKFGRRLESDVENCDEILHQMRSRNHQENTLAVEVEERHWGRRKLPFKIISSSELTDFPELTENDLKLLFTGSYQLTQSVSYLAEIMDEDNNVKIAYCKEANNVLRIDVPSRHVRSKTYKCFIDYVKDSQGCGAIKRYCCDCPNGNRTVGCCSHVAAIVYYLSHARYLAKILRPAEILSKLFTRDQYMPVINEDSDED